MSGRGQYWGSRPTSRCGGPSLRCGRRSTATWSADGGLPRATPELREPRTDRVEALSGFGYLTLTGRVRLPVRIDWELDCEFATRLTKNLASRKQAPAAMALPSATAR
jgi:hypothetical protein